MDADYPAAHSMDTHWFAVDRCGHVARFYSGEAGAVPTAAQVEPGKMDVAAELYTGLPTVSRELIDWAGRVQPVYEEERAHVYAELMEKGTDSVLVQVASLDAVRDDIASGTAKPLSTEAVLYPQMDAAAYKRLHSSAVCKKCFYYEESSEGTAASRGFFAYDHLCENWISGPYGREAVPDRPILLSQLPIELQRTLEKMRFSGLCFAQAIRIQPVEHGPCDSWESAWLDVEGKRARPIPGREDEYRAAFENREKGVEYESPTPGSGPGAPPVR